MAGDSGYGAKLETAWRPERLPVAFRGSEVYAFGDAGQVTINSRNGAADRDLDLASAGVGVRLAVRERTVIEVEGARALDDPRPDEDRRWRLALAVSTRF